MKDLEVIMQTAKENPKTKWGDRDWVRLAWNDWEVEAAPAAEAER